MTKPYTYLNAAAVHLASGAQYEAAGIMVRASLMACEAEPQVDAIHRLIARATDAADAYAKPVVTQAAAAYEMSR